MSEVDLLLEPFNNGEKSLPVLRVDDHVFAYDTAGLHVIPAVRKGFLFTVSQISLTLFPIICTERISTYGRMDKTWKSKSESRFQRCRCGI